MRKLLSHTVISLCGLLILLSVASVVFRYVVLHDYKIIVSDEIVLLSNAGGLAAIESDSQACEWADAPMLLVSQNVFSPLIYYSHIFPAIGALVLILLVWRARKKLYLNRIFLLLSTAFIAWTLSDLVLWATDNPSLVMLFWSLQIYFELSIYILAWLLLYTFATEKTPGRLHHSLLFIISLPVIVLAPTALNLVAFDYTNCDREALEGSLWLYVYALEIITVITVTLYGIFSAIRTQQHNRKQIIFLTSGLIFFLASFSIGNIVGSFTEDWTIAQYGLFGMLIFLASVTYLIVQYQFFRVRVIAAAALVVSLWILLFSILLFESLESARPIIILTLVVFAFIGVLLNRSIQKEIRQREQIEALANDLAKANVRLKELDKMKTEFVSIASHQLRSPLTAIRGYASLLTDGTYGNIPEKMREPLNRIEDSSRFMALSIDDFLNVSRIESGSMKYEKSIFSLSEMASRLADDLRPAAMKKGLVLVYRSDADGDMKVNADNGKLRQVIQNVVDNALKYTPKGTITIVAKEDMKAKKARIMVVDTGVGMSPETQQSLFGKFIRAKNANTVNVFGTGLGLYIGKQMLEAMGGTLTATSEGEGKGSTFTIELPLSY